MTNEVTMNLSNDTPIYMIRTSMFDAYADYVMSLTPNESSVERIVGELEDQYPDNEGIQVYLRPLDVLLRDFSFLRDNLASYLEE